MNLRFTHLAVRLTVLLTALCITPAFCQAQKPQLVVQTGQTNVVCSVCFSPDGRILASASFDNTVKLWDVATKQLLRTLTGTGMVTSVCFSPDGKTLAIGSSDGAVRLWDAATGRELARLYIFDDGGWAVVDPQGRFDTGNLDNIQDIHWVLPDQPFTPVPVGAFFAQYYTPGLMARLLHHDSLPPLPDIGTINHAQGGGAASTLALQALVQAAGLGGSSAFGSRRM